MNVKISSSSRRDFIKKSVGVSVAVAAGGILTESSALSYSRIRGANERINVSVMGVNSRGDALAQSFASQENCDVLHVCDVDSRAISKCIDGLSAFQQIKTEGFRDFRKSLESKDIDAIIIATPDHWHAPATLLAVQAGKHVYVEKPCSHNPAEGEILVKAAVRYGKVIQMGSQRRSYPNVITAVQELKNGIIGRAYFGRGWYTNNRGPIGIGKETPVPDWLDWELWQGPAPRKPYKDNVVHYNWHWFWHWGTGEALNNGTHMADLMRWGLGVNYPVRVSSNGGRYHYKDDWETPDTQVISLDFDEGVTITWEGRSCSGQRILGTYAGAIFYGEKGSMFIDGNSYSVYDLKDNIIKEVKDVTKVDPLNISNPSANLDIYHIRNFFDAISKGAKPNADIATGHKSTLLVQLGNIAQRVGRSLDIDKNTGHIIGDKEANRLWGRTYEKGWEMKL
jgi:predicted dehydrogenase